MDLGPPKQQAVLALLLLHAGRPVPLKQIVDTLWNGDPPENGVDVVQRYIGGLRRALDPGRTSLLALTEGGYVLRAGENIDVGNFRAVVARAQVDEVRDALESWRNEPLAGLTGPVFASARAGLIEERARASHFLNPAAAEPTHPPTKPSHPTPTLSRPAHLDPTAVAPARLERTVVEPARLQSTVVDPALAKSAPATPPPPTSAPTPFRPTSAPTSPQPAPTPARPPQPDPVPSAPTRAEHPAADPDYPEPTDPWAGHDLFPPGPMS
ncbi:winged helix-turn-helix domain-containing protein [Actinoplanes sp. NPDC051861]|uniref:AfsR/SARP family transcriptional regulator n=1 Tax=Actinoplanes sp. NPDC051861 TaxID=3155170 RepID=UPI003414246D